MKPYDKLITLVTTIALALGMTYLCTLADDPAHPAPDALAHPATNRIRPLPPRVELTTPQQLESVSTNSVSANKSLAPAVPIYIITELYVVTTPQGPLALVDESDFKKLAKLFGGAQRLTNFVIYTK